MGVLELWVEINDFISRRLELVGFLTALEVDLARCVLKERIFILGGCELVFVRCPEEFRINQCVIFKTSCRESVCV